MTYRPPPETLARYADVLVNFALGGGRRVQRDEVVRIVAHEAAKPLYVALHRAVWRAGAHTLGLPARRGRGVQPAARLLRMRERGSARLLPWRRDARHDRPDRSPGRVLSDSDMHALEGVDPAKIMRHGRARSLDGLARGEGERRALQWTLGLYGTPAMAAEAGLKRGEYWEQIIGACFLDEQEPIARWREVSDAVAEIRRAAQRAGDLPPAVVGRDVDLRLTLGERRRWVGEAGATSRASRSSRARTGAEPRDGSLQPAPVPLRQPGEGNSARFAEGRVVRRPPSRTNP